MDLFSILVVDDEPNQAQALSDIFKEQGYDVSTAFDLQGATDLLMKRPYDVILSDFRMPGGSGLDIAKKTRELCPESLIMIMTAYADIESVIEAMRVGVLDYFLKPLNIEFLLQKIALIRERRDLQKEVAFLRTELNRKYGEQVSLVGSSHSMDEIRKLVEHIASSRGTVLITGESGTGKEVAARQIHLSSAQSKKKFVAVNCGAIPENLLESELFGHKKGSFTGATEDKIGLFAVAHGGTLFLDEIGEMPKNLQVKLLRVLQEKEIWPVGGAAPVKVDVRIIAATNRNLEEAIQAGTFRSDLFYRINVVEIKMPPLREHIEDVPLLVQRCIKKLAKELKKPTLDITNDALRKLMVYRWPGNVRELENVIERAMILHRDGDRIEVCDLPVSFQELGSENGVAKDTLNLDEAIRVFSRSHIAKVLDITGSDKKEASKVLGLSLSSLYRKLEELEVMTKKEVEQK